MRLKVMDYITINEKQFRIENIFTLVLLFVSEIIVNIGLNDLSKCC